MPRDNEFEPELGRIRATPSKGEGRYLGSVLKGTAKAGGLARPGRSSFTGARIGRGAGVGRVLAARDKYAAFRSRRVIVKTRVIKLQGHLNAAKVHLRYLQRDGVTREGLPGELYDAAHDRAGGRAFLERGEGDRHQFRFIVSADDGASYDDLKVLTRRLMARMEADLDTRLDWVAVDHHNTGHPHTHILLRGKDETGKDLVIARDYIRHGMRERAAEIVTLDLGLRTDREIKQGLRAEIEQERFTSLDWRLLREINEERVVLSGRDEEDGFRQALRAGRLQKLRRLGLATEITPGRWQLGDDLEPVLRRLGERGDIIKAIHAELQRQGRGQSIPDAAIYDAADPEAKRPVGRVLARGLADEEQDRHYLVLDGVDGRTHYVDIGRGDEVVPVGTIVSIAPKSMEPRAVDRTVAEIAAAHGGRYSVALHRAHDPSAGTSFVEAHIRRLEAMRRQGGLVDREPDGSWIVADNHLVRAADFECKRARSSPVIVEMLSAIPLEQQLKSEGATWLDRELIAREPMPLRAAGFGKDVRAAQVRRQQWLIEQDLARQEGERIVYRANLLALLRRRELNRVAGQLADELGLAYREAARGERIEGIYRRPLDLASGRYALIERSREFTLAPWRPVLERARGRAVSGALRGERVSWSIGRERQGPSIS